VGALRSVKNILFNLTVIIGFVGVSEDPIQAISGQAADRDLLVMGGLPRGWRGIFHGDRFLSRVADNADITTVAVLSCGGGHEPWLKRLPLGAE
jgi:hypothetical protein